MPQLIPVSMRFVVIIVAILLLAGCAVNDMDAASIQSAQNFKSGFDATSPIAPGDVLSVSIEGEPDLSGDFKVNPDGTVTLPLVSNIPVVGLVPESAGRAIDAEYRKGYLVNPVIRVVKKLPPAVFVMGAVFAPGSYKSQKDMTVMNAVSLAGGAKPGSDTSVFEIVRGGHLYTFDGQASVQDGDVVLVKARHGL